MSSFTINRVVLIGRLTKDTELRSLPSGLNVCTLRVACNTARRSPEGEYKDKPNYFDVSVYGAAAENVSRYTHKGSRIAIDGRLEWREWETSEQQKRQSVSVVADTVLFLDSPGERSENSAPQSGQPHGGESHDGFGGDGDGELVGVGAAAGDDDLVF